MIAASRLYFFNNPPELASGAGFSGARNAKVVIIRAYHFAVRVKKRNFAPVLLTASSQR